jgi:hypothetical protein
MLIIVKKVNVDHLEECTPFTQVDSFAKLVLSLHFDLHCVEIGFRYEFQKITFGTVFPFFVF